MDVVVEGGRESTRGVDDDDVDDVIVLSIRCRRPKVEGTILVSLSLSLSLLRARYHRASPRRRRKEKGGRAEPKRHRNGRPGGGPTDTHTHTQKKKKWGKSKRKSRNQRNQRMLFNASGAKTRFKKNPVSTRAKGKKKSKVAPLRK